MSADDGTGIVHTAIAFGEDDYRLGAEQGLAVVNPVRLDGTYDERIGPYAGRWVKDADPDLIADLRARGRLLREERLLHAYPHCWRCGTPLLYYAKPSWYIRTAAKRDRLLAANETVEWHPGHIKHGRFGRWLENNVDWAISRERYWGTPLPVWRCAGGHVECLGSFAEVEARSGRALPDPHRPFVDEHAWPCAECGEEMRRVPEVIDVWFDSGAMPFAQFHAPFENREQFEASFPADYICEAIDQTRGWFYSLLAVSTLLFDASPYRTVLSLGHIADPQGKKMSKSLGNIVVPWEVIDRHGADAFRWYFLTSKQPWDGYLFSADTVGESVRQFLLQLWNTYGFYVLYANVNDVRERGEPETDLDRWAISRLHATVAEVRERLEALRRHARRPRHRRLRGRPLQLVRPALAPALLGRATRRPSGRCTPASSRSAKLLAPFCPFLADAIYENLDGTEPSVHLCDFPEAGPRDEALEAAMAVARETVKLGLAARGHGKLKVRQPLRAAVVVAAGRGARGDRAPRARRAGGAQRQGAALRRRGRRARLVRRAPELPRARPALREADAAGGGGRRGARRPAGGERAARGRPGRPQRGRPRARARAGRPHAGHAPARRLPARARGLARRRPGAGARRRAAPGDAGAGDHPRGPERPQDGRACAWRTASSSAWAATPSCSPPPAPTRTRCGGRRWRCAVAYDAAAGEEALIEQRPLRVALLRHAAR